ncbi:MAG TPA: 5'-nucleotidase C-terminal domain-containing protein [Bacteroidota bacterium]|nr:5'-nucleotidase C-terminal domain-containing protein [Bacteroidota bacterium]
MQKPFTGLLRVSVLLVLCASLALSGGTTITIVHVNDTHSHIDAFGPKDFHLNGTIGGIAKAAYIFGSIRATESNVVLLHGGDAFVGDFFYNKYFGIPELQLMSSLGFDAMAVGNHEFDLTADMLAFSLANANPSFKLLSANLVMGAYGQASGLVNYIQPSIMIERGVKIGIFGLTVWDNPTTTPGPMTIVEPGAIAAQTVADLRAQGAVVVICLSHMGFLHDKEIAAAVPGIDVIVGAHDHYLFQKPVRVQQTLILQAGAFYQNVGELKLHVDGKKITLVDYRIIPVDRRVPAVPEIQAVVNGLKPDIEAQFGNVYHNVVGFAACDQELLYDESSQIRDTPMGDLVTDAMREKGKTQLGFSAIGLINEKIYAGPIVGADVFRSFPYGFDPATGLGLKLVRVKATGLSLIVGLESALSFLGINEDYFPQISGMTFKYDGKKPAGSRVIVSSMRVGGKPFDPTAVYTMTIDEGLFPLLGMLGVDASLIDVMPDYEYVVVKDFIHHRGVIAYRPEGRIRDVSVKCRNEYFADDDAAIAAAPGDQPAVVKDFELGQNFPNPFNPTTVIRYALPGRTRANVTVFNALGQVVRELVNEDQEAGYHEVRFDGTGLASGVYFYRLHAGSFVETKKLTLLK